MNPWLKEIRHNPLLWLLIFVPVVFAAHNLRPEAHTLLFVLSVLAIVPLAALLSHATESVDRHPHRVARHQQPALGVVHRGAGAYGLCDRHPDALFIAAASIVNSRNNPLTPNH